MGKVSARESSDHPDVPEGAPDPFQRLLEDRYSEWEREFGDDIEETHNFL